MIVRPIDQQGEFESRRLWEKVARGIKSGNYDEAAKEKTRIEVRLRWAVRSCESVLTAEWFRRMSNGSGGKMRQLRGLHGLWSGSATSGSDPEYQSLAAMLQ